MVKFKVGDRVRLTNWNCCGEVKGFIISSEGELFYVVYIFNSVNGCYWMEESSLVPDTVLSKVIYG